MALLPRLSRIRRRPPLVTTFSSFLFADADDVLGVAWPGTAADADRKKFTISYWSKAFILPETSPPTEASTGSVVAAVTADFGKLDLCAALDQGTFVQSGFVAGELYDEGSGNEAWSHFVFQIDTANAIEGDRIKVYKDGVELLARSTSPPVPPITQDYVTAFFESDATLLINSILLSITFGKTAIIDLCPGNLYAPSAFALDVGGVWTVRSAPSVSYGTLGGRWDGSDGFNDVSGNGLHLTDNGTGVHLDNVDVPPHQ